MDKFINILNKMSDKVSNCLTNISMISIIIWPIIMTVYIILRRLNICWLFVEEFTEYWLVLVVFFGLTYTLKTKSHINIDIVVKCLPQRIRKTLEIITMSLSFLVVMFLLNSSIDYVKYGIECKVYSSYQSHILLWPVYAIIPIGFLSFGLEMFIGIYNKFKELLNMKKKKYKIQ